MKRVYWGLVAVVAIAAGVFLADLFLADGVVLPTAPYAVAIVVAAYFGELWLVAVATGLTFALELTSALLQRPPQPTWPLSLVSLALIGGLAGALTWHGS